MKPAGHTAGKGPIARTIALHPGRTRLFRERDTPTGMLVS